MEHSVIIGKRQTGKTERLIKMSAEKQAPIICYNVAIANEIKRRAKYMHLDIPEPIAASDNRINILLREAMQGGAKSVLVDDVAVVLANLLGINVSAIAVNTGTGAEGIEPITVIYTDDEQLCDSAE